MRVVASRRRRRPIARSMNAVRSIVRALRINTRAIELKMGISLAQLFVLQQLAERPADSLNELADRTATHQSSVSVVVRRLVERGYVSRTASAADKRRIQIEVTPRGRALLADAPKTIQTQMMQALRYDGARTIRNALADLLERWLRAADIDVAAPPMLGEDEDTRSRPRVPERRPLAAERGGRPCRRAVVSSRRSRRSRHRRLRARQWARRSHLRPRHADRCRRRASSRACSRT